MCLLSPNLHNQPAEYCPHFTDEKTGVEKCFAPGYTANKQIGLPSGLPVICSIHHLPDSGESGERKRNIIKSLPPKSCPLAVFHPANNLPATPTLEHFGRFPELSAFVHEVARSSLPPRSRNRAFAPKYTLSSLFHYKTPHSQWFLSVPLLMLIPGIIPGFWDLPTWT